jgi:hypothetical protein
MVAQTVVAGVLLGSPGVADPGPYDSVEAPELGLSAPESAKGERSRLNLAGLLLVEERDIYGAGALRSGGRRPVTAASQETAQ